MKVRFLFVTLFLVSSLTANQNGVEKAECKVTDESVVYTVWFITGVQVIATEYLSGKRRGQIDYLVCSPQGNYFLVDSKKAMVHLKMFFKEKKNA
jgi:hypothetical protein